MSDIAYQVRTELSRYVARETSLRRFVEAFLALSWATPDEAGPVADLVHEIELRLAEHSNGHLTEDELRAHLSRLLAE
jgi:hypothetical protein